MPELAPRHRRAAAIHTDHTGTLSMAQTRQGRLGSTLIFQVPVMLQGSVLDTLRAGIELGIQIFFRREILQHFMTGTVRQAPDLECVSGGACARYWRTAPLDI